MKCCQTEHVSCHRTLLRPTWFRNRMKIRRSRWFLKYLNSLIIYLTFLCLQVYSSFRPRPVKKKIISISETMIHLTETNFFNLCIPQLTFGSKNSPVRYVLKIHFFLESGLKMIQFKIQFKTKSKIFIQKNIHSIESKIFNRIIHSLKMREIIQNSKMRSKYGF